MWRHMWLFRSIKPGWIARVIFIALCLAFLSACQGSGSGKVHGIPTNTQGVDQFSLEQCAIQLVEEKFHQKLPDVKVSAIKAGQVQIQGWAYTCGSVEETCKPGNETVGGSGLYVDVLIESSGDRCKLMEDSSWLEDCKVVCPTPPALPSPVPLATWIAQGVPNDMVIKFNSENPFMGSKLSVTIYADGTIESTNIHLDKSASGIGRISQEELKRILVEFAEVDFFSLAVGKLGCVYNVQHPPPEETNQIYQTDSPQIMISLTIQGISKSIDYDYGCGFADYNFGLPRKLPDMLYELGNRFAGEPKQVILTPKSLAPTDTP